MYLHYFIYLVYASHVLVVLSSVILVALVLLQSQDYPAILTDTVRNSTTTSYN